MTWSTTVRNYLMGASYEHSPIIAPTEAKGPLVPVPYEVVEPLLQLEEAMIQDLRRRERMSDAPVMAADDPAVRAASFRVPYAGKACRSQAEKWERVRLAAEADVPVVGRSAQVPVLTDQQLGQAEVTRQRSIRREDKTITPVVRKVA